MSFSLIAGAVVTNWGMTDTQSILRRTGALGHSNWSAWPAAVRCPREGWPRRDAAARGTTGGSDGPWGYGS